MLKISVPFIFLAYFSVDAHAVGAEDTRSSELAAANEKLNSTYQSLLKHLSKEDQTNLRAAQRAWIQFRDLDCKWAFSAEKIDCFIDRTLSRTKELNETLFFDVEGNYGVLKK